MCGTCESWSGWILKVEREACCCGSVTGVLSLLQNTLSVESPPLCSVMSLTSFLRLVLGAMSRDRVCGSLQEIALVLKRIKVELCGILYKMYKGHAAIDPFLRASLENILFPLLFVIPCHPHPCESLCKSILQSFLPLSDILPFFLPLLNWEEEDPISHCNASIPSHGEYGAHRNQAIKFIGHFLSNHWKSLYGTLYSSESVLLRDKYIFITIWNQLVRLHTSACYPGFKNFISHLNCLVVPYRADYSPSLWKQELEVLNAALCYGSTLGLQNEIPADIFSLSQRLISLSKSKDYFSSISLPKVPSPGMAGHLADESEIEGKVDSSLGHKLILLHLKSIAILVREAQCCSSSEESDASSGAESMINSDLVNIEKSILDILEYMTNWMRPTFLFQHDASFLHMFMKIFREQDDVLIEGLLCLLDIYIGSKISSEDLSPLIAFQLFSESISLDHSVLLDFLLSNETCFLLYFLRFLKYLNRGSRIDLITTQQYQNVYHILSNLKTSIDKLTDKGLFPYDISPVHKLLKHLIK